MLDLIHDSLMDAYISARHNKPVKARYHLMRAAGFIRMMPKNQVLVDTYESIHASMEDIRDDWGLLRDVLMEDIAADLAVIYEERQNRDYRRRA